MNRPALTDTLPYIVAACAAHGLSFLIPNTSPFVVGGLVTGWPMAEATAGLVLTLELLAMGAAALVVAPRMAVLSRRRLAMGGAAAMVIANALVILLPVPAFSGLLALRLLAGAGAGLVLASANAAIAASAGPTRLYGVAIMAGWILAALLGPVMAFAMARASYTGTYVVWLVLAALALPLLHGLGGRPSAGAGARLLPDQSLATGLVHMGGIALTGMAMMAYFAFVERLATHNGFSAVAVGWLFAGVSATGALGAGLAALLGERLGLRAPLVIGTLAHAVAIAVAVNTGARPVFVMAVLVEGLSFMYLLAYQFATAAALDARGRWAAAASGAMIGSTGVGPYLGGALISAFGFGALGWLVLATAAPAVAAFAFVGGRVDAGRAAVGGTGD